MALGLGLTVRPPENADVSALLDLFNACDESDIGHPDSDEEEIVWRWRDPAFDVQQDAWLVERDGDAVAYAWLLEDDASVRVHPVWRGRGIGSELRALVERRAVDIGTDIVRQNVTNRQPDARTLLEGAGYVYSHSYSRMEIELEHEPEPVVWPEGVEVRTYQHGLDDAALHDASQRAWQEYPHHRRESLERWLLQTQEAGFSPDIWFIAEEAGEIAGLSLCFALPHIGWLQNLATIPSHRHRGIARALLQHTFAELHRRGYRRVGLTVSTRAVPEAKRLYERAGMIETLRIDNLQKELRTAEARPVEATTEA